jgi:serine/threonine protein kinase
VPGSGSLLANRYRLHQLLGRGGMGEVYEAAHVEAPERFAIKLLRADYEQEPAMRARFRLEAEAAASLTSDHIVQVLDFGHAEDGSPYLVMELLEGCNLRAAFQERGPFASAEAVDVVMQACAGVHVAHEQRIVHRDLKPENLFLARRSEHYTVKLLDFGIAKLRGQGTSATGGRLLGTPAYMSPEQARGEKGVDARTDVYALGAILYEALSGRLPHPGETPHQIITHLLFEEPEPVARWAPHVHRGLANVVHKALRPARADRYPSAAALRSALASYADARSEGPIVLTPPAQARGAPPVALVDCGETLAAQDSELQSALAALPLRRGDGRSLARRHGPRVLTGAALGVALTIAAAMWWSFQVPAARVAPVSQAQAPQPSGPPRAVVPAWKAHQRRSSAASRAQSAQTQRGGASARPADGHAPAAN